MVIYIQLINDCIAYENFKDLADIIKLRFQKSWKAYDGLVNFYFVLCS